MIRVQIGNLTISADTPDELDRQLGRFGAPLTEKEMSELAGVDERTIRNWKHLPTFPRTETGTITRRDFFAFLFRAKPEKNGK